MALPAGRYGVTKRQLNKVKNLPVNTIGMIEEALETSEEYTDDTIVNTVGWSGKNKYDFKLNEAQGVNARIDFTQTGVRVYTAEDTAYCVSNVSTSDLNLKNGDEYVLESDVTYVSGVGRMALREGNTIKASTPNITQSGKYTLRFIMSPDLTSVSLFSTLSTSEAGDITYNNITLTHITVEEQKANNSVIAPVEDQATCQNPDGYAAGDHFIRNKKFCTAITSIANGATFTLNTNYVEGKIADNLKKFDEELNSVATLFTGNSYITDSIINLSESLTHFREILFLVGINGPGGGFETYTLYSGGVFDKSSGYFREYERFRYYDDGSEQFIVIQWLSDTQVKINQGSQSESGHGIRNIYGIGRLSN